MAKYCMKLVYSSHNRALLSVWNSDPLTGQYIKSNFQKKSPLLFTILLTLALAPAILIHAPFFQSQFHSFSVSISRLQAALHHSPAISLFFAALGNSLLQFRRSSLHFYCLIWLFMV